MLTGKNPENPAAVKPEQSDNRATMSINEWVANTLPTVERALQRRRTALRGPSRQPDRTHGQLTVVESRRFIQCLKQWRKVRAESPLVRPPACLYRLRGCVVPPRCGGACDRFENQHANAAVRFRAEVVENARPIVWGKFIEHVGGNYGASTVRPRQTRDIPLAC